MASRFVHELFKELHKDEIDRMHKLDAAVGLPSAVITVLFGVGTYYLNNFPHLQFNYLVIVFQLLCLVFWVLLLLATFHLIRSMFRGDVTIPARPNELADFVVQLEEYYESGSSNRADVDELVDNDLREVLRQQYVECSSQNRLNNIIQSNRQFRAKLCIAWAIVALFISAIPFQIIQHGRRREQDVNVVNLPDVQKVEILDRSREETNDGQ